MDSSPVIGLVSRPDGTAPRPRARDLGLPFPGRTGPANAITDVAGIEVGCTTLIGSSADGRAIRTGVTVILPRGRSGRATIPVWAGFHALNGNGEMTGTHWIREAGYFLGPIGITNTHSLGTVHTALARWMVEAARGEPGPYPWLMPVVGETCDGYLNDMNGFHVTERHVFQALDSARGGVVAEGNVGGGTGMVCFDFKGGTGTASRVVHVQGSDHVVGCLVQANFGLRPWLRVLGVPVGDLMKSHDGLTREQGSIIVVVATDAPLLPNQLDRLARRAGLGIGRTGTPSGDGSGDLCLAFSTANAQAGGTGDLGLSTMTFLPHERLDPLFEAAAEVVEEAIVNALVAAEAMVGLDGHQVEAMPHDGLVAAMRAHGRLGPDHP